MFKLLDGREHLWQWDLDRQIAVSDSTVTEVHFCNKTDDCSLVVKVVDGIANIPNILLQQPFDIRVYAYCACYTKVEATFKVKARTQPSDYVYTETETLQYSTLGNRIDELQEQVEALDVSNFYTRAETDTAIEEAREVFYLDLSYADGINYTNASEEQQAVFNRLHNGEQLTIYVRDLYAYAVADIHVNPNTITLVVHFTEAFSATQTTIIHYVASLYKGAWGVKKERTTTNDFTTKQYVDDAIAGIDISGESPYVYTINIEDGKCTNLASELSILYNKIISGERVICYWSCPDGICLTRVRINSETLVVMITPAFAYVRNHEVNFISGQLNIQSNGSGMYITTTNSETAPTITKVEEMISNALNGIATAEGGSY